MINERIRILYIKDHYIDTSTYVRYNYFIPLKGVFILDTALIYKCEAYMQTCLKDDMAHDPQHMYRVLKIAMDIADHEPSVDKERLIIACLLHDIGRSAQLKDPALCDAEVGSEMAYGYLTENAYDRAFAESVRLCILTHRFRKSRPPQSIEAKILFDADKLDAAGAVGIARTLVYKGTVGEPLYSVLPDGSVSDGAMDEVPSFFQEYKRKLEKLYSGFYTERGAQLAAERKQAAEQFYLNLYSEVSTLRDSGKIRLDKILRK